MSFLLLDIGNCINISITSCSPLFILVNDCYRALISLDIRDIIQIEREQGDSTDAQTLANIIYNEVCLHLDHKYFIIA